MLRDYFLESKKKSKGCFKFNPLTVLDNARETPRLFTRRPSTLSGHAKNSFASPCEWRTIFEEWGKKESGDCEPRISTRKLSSERERARLRAKTFLKLRGFCLKKKRRENKRKEDRERDGVDTSLWADKEVYGWSVKKFYTDELRTIGTTAITTRTDESFSKKENEGAKARPAHAFMPCTERRWSRKL